MWFASSSRILAYHLFFGLPTSLQIVAVQSETNFGTRTSFALKKCCPFTLIEKLFCSVSILLMAKCLDRVET